MPDSPRSDLPSAELHQPASRDDIGIFLALTFLFSSPLYYLHALSTSPAAGTYIRLLMWSPGLAALLTLRLGLGVGPSIGWRWPRPSQVAVSCCIPIAYLLVTYVIGIGAGGGSFPNAQYVQSTRKSFAWTTSPEWVVMLGFLVLTGITRIITESATALGEEIGWRGFLVPALARRFTFGWTALISGVIWSGWHLPLIFVHQPNAFGRENLIGAGCLVLSLTGASFPLAWLRLRSGSVWSATLFHSAHNVFNGFALALVLSNAQSPLLLDETGLIMAGVGICLAILFLWLEHRSPASSREQPA